MKRILFFGALLLFVPSLLFAQDIRINTHGYSTDFIKEDSSSSYQWRLSGLDIDTSETFSIDKYVKLSTHFKFGFVGTAHADSISQSWYLQISVDDTSWCIVDSIGAADITVAKLTGYSGSDTAYVKGWTFPAAKSGRIIGQGWAGNAKGNNGVYIYPKIFKQQ